MTAYVGIAIVILSIGLAFTGIIWATNSSLSGGKQPPNPSPKAKTAPEPPAMWTTKTTVIRTDKDKPTDSKEEV